jgi:dolichol-phosphate mannosyltransferase
MTASDDLVPGERQPGHVTPEGEPAVMTPPKSALVALVVPTYQEAENIGAFLRAARATLPDAHLVVCDDGSPDGTGSIAEEVGAEIGNSEVLHRPGKRGLGAAYRHGFRIALDHGADVIVQMDVDFSHPHALLPAMIDRIDAGADVVIGSRYVPGGGTPDWPRHRRMLSNYGNLYARRLLGLAARDATSGLRAYRAASLEKIAFGTTRANGYGFMLEILWRLTVGGARVVEVPLIFHDRVAGQSKMSIAIILENLLLVTWWGLSIRFPRLARTVRTSPAGDYLSDRASRLA